MALTTSSHVYPGLTLPLLSGAAPRKKNGPSDKLSLLYGSLPFDKAQGWGLCLHKKSNLTTDEHGLGIAKIAEIAQKI